MGGQTRRRMLVEKIPYCVCTPAFPRTVTYDVERVSRMGGLILEGRGLGRRGVAARGSGVCSVVGGKCGAPVRSFTSSGRGFLQREVVSARVASLGRGSSGRGLPVRSRSTCWCLRSCPPPARHSSPPRVLFFSQCCCRGFRGCLRAPR